MITEATFNNIFVRYFTNAREYHYNYKNNNHTGNVLLIPRDKCLNLLRSVVISMDPNTSDTGTDPVILIFISSDNEQHSDVININ